MKPIGELYSLPIHRDGDFTVPPFPVRHSVSLAGARKGDYCPVDLAEIKAPASETILRTQWGTFLRTKVENRPPGYKQEPEIIEAWFRQ